MPNPWRPEGADGASAEGPRLLERIFRASRECWMATRSRSGRCGSVSGASMRRRADRAALPGAAAGPAADGQPRHSPAGSTAVRSLAKNVIGTGASLRCAGTAGGTSTLGWSAKDGRWRSAGIRGRTWRRSRRRKRRGGDSGAENSFVLGTGAKASACGTPTGTLSAPLLLPAIVASATSRATSAAAVGGASTTFPVIRTMHPHASVRDVVSGGSVPKPKRVRRVGGAPVGDLSTPINFCRPTSTPVQSTM